MSPPLRILMTCDAVGGVWPYSLDLCRTLAGQDTHILLAVLGPPPSAGQRLAAASIPGLDLIETGAALDWTARHPGEVEEAAGHVAMLAEAHAADLIHLNSPALAATVHFPAPTVAVAHSCVGTWWRAVRSGTLPVDLAWRSRLHGAGLRRADIAVAPSRSFAAATGRCHGLRRLPQAIHNGRSALPFAPAAMHDFAFTAGRIWDEGKNLATLDRAAARLSIPFRAAGALAGPNGERMALAHIVPVGSLDEAALGRELSRRPVFASAARYEPFGLAVLEAAAAGCPLVLSDIPTFRELWDGVASFVDPDDDQGFADTISQLIGDTRARIERGEAARAHARRYSPAAMGEAMMAAYRQVLEGSGAAVRRAVA